ncbi:T9SS type A sorting domain-containing protein [Cytophagaceae bacterium ABcell3]|nr:T9SS type A sorting domain-containing protein [Cytophagaceae bacterium ABcell3]
MRKLLFFIALFFCALNCSAQEFNGFESFPSGHEYTMDSWIDDGFDPRWVNGFNQSRAFVDNQYAVSGENSLRVLFPEDGVGPANSGAQAPLNLEPRDEYYVSYWLRFSDNFSWGSSSFGGKLPGLAGGGNCSGCSECTGYNGFSARLMWRAEGRAVLYLYDMDKPGNCGTDYNLTWENGDVVHFEKGKWYNIIERVKVNTGDNNDGEVELWVDGEHALLVENLRFVNNGDKVDNFYFSTFHGGSGPGWEPGVDCFIWFDDIKIGTTPEEVFPPECTAPDLNSDVSFCGTEGTLTLNTQLDETDRSFQWYKDGVLLSESSGQLEISETGKYRVVVDSLGCVREDSVRAYATIPEPELTTEYNLCDPAEILLDTRLPVEQYTFQWYRNDQPLEGDTSPYLEVRAAGNYVVNISADGCEPVEVMANISSALPEGVGDCLPEPGVAFLEVIPQSSEDGPFAWYTAPEGGTLLHGGQEYDPFVEETTTFYVQDNTQEVFHTGKLERDGQVWNISDFDSEDKMMRLIVERELYLDSVTVYASDDQDLVVRITKNGEVLKVVEKAVEVGKVRLHVGITLEPGSYLMDADGSSGRLVYGAENGGLPYIVEDVVELTGNAPWVMNNDRYPLFYNVRIRVGTGCARLPVVAEVGGCSDAQPVELLYFKGASRKGQALLHWATATEQNAKRFLIMKALNGMDFKHIGSVEAVGNSSDEQRYIFTDHDFLESAYYKLISEDYDGSTEESKIIFIGNSDVVFPEVFPNPFANAFQIKTRGREHFEFIVSDIAGVTLFSGNTESRSSYGEALKAGVYLITFYNKSGKKTDRIVKLPY